MLDNSERSIERVSFHDNAAGCRLGGKIAAETHTLREAALRLGVAESTLRGAVREGVLPLQVLRIGDRTLIPRAQLDALLGGSRQADEQARLCADLDRIQELLELSVAVVTQMLALQGALATVAAELAGRAAQTLDDQREHVDVPDANVSR